ncbi:MAG: glutamate racemase [Oscillospiraceae bacterium]
MNRFTIGVFDSGLGGLTAMAELSRLLPHEDIVYFGDTGHMPYGGRDRGQLLYMARRNIAFLEELGAKLILAACGTVTSVALDTVSSETNIPLFGVAYPAVYAARDLAKNKKIGFIATQACIDSGYNQTLLKWAVPDAQIVARACPKFVPLIESGICSADSPELMSAIDDYLCDVRSAGVDVLILGCTHYPIISEAISRYMGENVRLISSSAEAADTLAAKLHSPGYTPDTSHTGKHTYYTSGNAELFRSLASKLLGHELDGEVISVPPYPLI